MTDAEGESDFGDSISAREGLIWQGSVAKKITHAYKNPDPAFKSGFTFLFWYI